MLINLLRLSTETRPFLSCSSVIRHEWLIGLSSLSTYASPVFGPSRQRFVCLSPSPSPVGIIKRHYSLRKNEVDNPYYPSRPYDEHVNSPIIHLVDQDNTFRRNQKLEHVLTQIDRTRYFVVQVVPGNSQENVPPTCRLILKEDIVQASRAKLEKKKKKKVDTSKQIQLNWAIDLKDLEHRLERVKEFLSEGRNVEVILAMKRRGKRANAAEAEMVVRRVNEAVASVPGAQELKTREGTIGGLLRLFYRGSKAQQ